MFNKIGDCGETQRNEAANTIRHLPSFTGNYKYEKAGRTQDTLAVPACLEVASQTRTSTYRRSGQWLDDRAGLGVRLRRAAEAILSTIVSTRPLVYKPADVPCASTNNSGYYQRRSTLWFVVLFDEITSFGFGARAQSAFRN